MSYLQVEPLIVVRDEYLAVQAAVSQVLADTARPGDAMLVKAAEGLETAYIARLFSVFEGILRGNLALNDPRHRRVPERAVDLINRTAAAWHIPDHIRDDVHEARRYRSSVAHPGGTTRSAISFSDARSILNKFLASLP